MTLKDALFTSTAGDRLLASFEKLTGLAVVDAGKLAQERAPWPQRTAAQLHELGGQARAADDPSEGTRQHLGEEYTHMQQTMQSPQHEIQRIEAILAGDVPTNAETVTTMQQFMAALAGILTQTQGLAWHHKTFQAVLEDLLSECGREDLATVLVEHTLQVSGWTASC